MTKNFTLAAFSFAAGGLLVLSFAPTCLWFIGFLAPALFLYSLLKASPKQAFWYGFCFGLGEFGIGTSWIYISIHNFGNANAFLAGLITSLFTLLMMSYPALQGYVFAKCFRKSSLFARCCLAFPSTWVIFEVLRSYLFTGFPWLALGYSQTNTFLNGYAPILSVFGLSLVVSFMSGALIFILSNARLRQKIGVLVLVALIVITAWPLHQKRWTQNTKRPLSVALVQGNIPQNMKWDAKEVMRTISKYVRTTEPYWNRDLIIWPEAAVPVLRRQAQGLIQELDEVGKQHNATLIFGIPINNDENTRYYNGVMAVGNGHGSYLKRHPVPFGEYIPLKFMFGYFMSYFDIPMSDLSKGPQKQALITANHLNIAPFICYEVTYPTEVVRYSRGSQLLLTVNDDSWFGDSLAQPQQIEMAKMRSIETARPMLYVSNTGITAIISRTGKIIQEAPENVLTVLTGSVQPVEGETPLMRFYFYPLIGFVSLFFILGLLLRKKHYEN